MSDTRPETLFALTALSPLDGRYAVENRSTARMAVRIRVHEAIA